MIFCDLSKISIIIIIIIITCNVDAIQESEQECVPKKFGYGSFVCVCNSTHCDSLAPIKSPKSGEVIFIVSDKESKRWKLSEGNISDFKASGDEDKADITVTLLKDQKFQKILGFGGAFTDATGINTFSLSSDTQRKLIRSYFDSDGLEYNLGRVPIAGSDFSTHPYSYDDLGPGQTDSSLKYFGLAREDLQFKIPYIKEAMKLCSNRGVDLKLYGSPWSGPAWMKDNGKINGKGKLLKNFYRAYASYIIKFLDSYKGHGITLYGLTAQNEPFIGFNSLLADDPFDFNTMGWLPEDQAEWIGEYLGPKMNQSGYGNLKIFILDDARSLLPAWAIKVMGNKEASKYVGGIAVHWYQDWISLPSRLDLTHAYFPTLPILYTEACAGWAPWDLFKVIPGSWVRAEEYASDIIENLQHWAVGWTDWNMALDMEGGPNWVNNFVDSPVLVNEARDEFYKQPMYYALAHISKVAPEGSVRIGTDVSGRLKWDLSTVAFERPDGSFSSVILNRNHKNVTVEIIDGTQQYRITSTPRSITSIVWRS